ncbi:putative ribonuclease H-like domain-containing protein, partial [Tanacetum coccineum]
EKGIRREYSIAKNGMRPFGCHVTILNTLDHLGKFDGKSDEVVAGTITNKSEGTQEELNAGTSTQQEEIDQEISQDCNVMPIWKDASYFDSPSKDIGNGEPKSAVDDQNPVVNTGRFKLNTVDPSINTASSYDLDSPKNMFKMGASHTLKATHVEFFSDKDESEVDLGNILNSYTVPTTPNTRIHKDHPIKNVIGDVKSSVQTRRMTKPTSELGFLSAVYKEKSHDTLKTCLYTCFLPQIEPSSIAKALSDSSWRAIGTKSVFRNKKDERGIVIRNKARLVAQGHKQEEGFKDPDNPDKVYKVVKALYGLHQAPRAWYETLANYILGNGFNRGKIDQTLFIKKQKGDILLIQMSSMGELTFFLGLQVQQKEDGIFISQDKYVDEILNKFNYTDVKSASTLVDLEKPLVKHGDANDVDAHLYRSMIGSLMYLTTSRPDIIFAVCACARFQVTPKTSHLLAVKRIFRYLKGKPTLGLWYSRDSPVELVAYTDSDYARATQDRKSTIGGCQFLGNMLISWQCKKKTVVATSITEAEYVVAASYLLTKGFDAGRLVMRLSIRSWVTKWKRAATTASSLEAEQESVTAVELLTTVRHHLVLPVQVNAAKAGKDGPQKKKSRRKQRKETEIPQDETHHDDSVPIPSNDPLLSGKGCSSKGDCWFKEEGLKVGKEKKKSRTIGLKRLRKVGESRRVESSKDKDSLGAQEDASKQGRSVEDIDKDTEVSQRRSNDAEMFDTDDLHGDEVIVDMAVGEKQEQSAKVDEREVSTSVEDSAAPTIPVTTTGKGVTAIKIDEITTTSALTTVINEIILAQTLNEIKEAKPKAITTAATTTTTRPKARGVVVQEPSEFRTTTSSPQASQPSKTKDKGKAIMIEPEVPLKKKDQVALDEEIARNLEAQLQTELIEEKRLARKKEEEANIALIESWENTQAMMEADRLLAERLQTREQEELTDKEKAKLFMEFMENKRKHFAALRAQEKRNRPPTKTQKRNQMSIYLKHDINTIS